MVIKNNCTIVREYISGDSAGSKSKKIYVLFLVVILIVVFSSCKLNRDLQKTKDLLFSYDNWYLYEDTIGNNTIGIFPIGKFPVTVHDQIWTRILRKQHGFWLTDNHESWFLLNECLDMRTLHLNFHVLDYLYDKQIKVKLKKSGNKKLKIIFISAGNEIASYEILEILTLHKSPEQLLPAEISSYPFIKLKVTEAMNWSKVKSQGQTELDSFVNANNPLID